MIMQKKVLRKAIPYILFLVYVTVTSLTAMLPFVLTMDDAEILFYGGFFLSATLLAFYFRSVVEAKE